MFEESATFDLWLSEDGFDWWLAVEEGSLEPEVSYKREYVSLINRYYFVKDISCL